MSMQVKYAMLPLVPQPMHAFILYLSLLITYLTVTRMFQVFVGHGASRDKKRNYRN